MDLLLSMGFTQSDVQIALNCSGGDFDSALEMLLSGNLDNARNDSHAGSFSSMESGQQIVELPISQYSFDEVGISACTVIAASMLDFLLNALQNGRDAHTFRVDELSDVVMQGVSRYAQLPKSTVQHASVDELPREFFSHIRSVEGGMIQGLLTNNSAFDNLIQQAREIARDDRHIGIVLTKPPETVCIILPMNSSEKQNFILFDSHSRPQDGLEGSYLFIADSQAALTQRLKKLFPVFPCDDLDGYMSSMYNMFEGNLFQCSSKGFV